MATVRQTPNMRDCQKQEEGAHFISLRMPPPPPPPPRKSSRPPPRPPPGPRSLRENSTRQPWGPASRNSVGQQRFSSGSGPVSARPTLTRAACTADTSACLHNGFPYLPDIGRLREERCSFAGTSGSTFFWCQNSCSPPSSLRTASSASRMSSYSMKAAGAIIRN